MQSLEGTNPKTLRGAVRVVNIKLTRNDCKTIKEGIKCGVGAIAYNHTLGTEIRNAWLWGDSALVKYMRKVEKIKHPDDMSNKILEDVLRLFK